jgi:hypothetical protein
MEVMAQPRIVMPIPEEDVVSAVAGLGGRVVAHRAAVLHPPVFGLYRCHRSHSTSPILYATESPGDGEDALSLPQVRPRLTLRLADCVLRVFDSLREGASGLRDGSVAMRWRCSDRVELLILS